MITAHADGTTEFRVFLPHASSVSLLGDFTDWRARPLPMRREAGGAGWWSARLAVPQGEHQFSYLVDETIWLADYAAHGVTLNTYGGWVSRLCITAQVELKPGATAPARGPAAAA